MPLTQHFYRHPELPALELRYGKTSEACYAVHTHAEYSLGAVLSGQAYYQYRQQGYDIGAGDTLLIAPNVPHACNAKPSGQWQYLMLYIERDYWQVLCRRYGCEPVANGAPRKDTALLRGLIRLHRVWSLGNTENTENTEKASTSAIETAWLDCFQRLCAVESNPRDNRRPENALNAAMIWLNHHVTDTVNLSDWSAEVGLPRHQLLRQFRRHVGMSPHQYLLNQRIQLAKTWLKSGERASDIAYRLGFSDQSHFQRTFKRYTAVTPKYYQRSK